MLIFGSEDFNLWRLNLGKIPPVRSSVGHHEHLTLHQPHLDLRLLSQRGREAALRCVVMSYE
jgi:hypothetical protein